MTHRIYDERAAARRVDPDVAARRRADRLEDPIDRHRFLAAFTLGRRYEESGHDSYDEFRRCLDADDSVTLAGLIEGQASCRTGPLHAVIDYDRRSPDRPEKKSVLGMHEKAVLLDAAQGFTAQQTADRYGVSRNTVQHRLRTARSLLKAKSVTHAIALAVATGEITPLELGKDWS